MSEMKKNETIKTYNELVINDEDNVTKSFEFRMLRSKDGVHVYCKSPLFHTMFKSFSNNTINPNIGEGWGVDMQPWDINQVLSDQMWDQEGAIINDFSDPDDYVPKTIRNALAYWNSGANDRASNQLLFNPNFNLENDSHGTPNMSWMLSNKLDEGIKILFTTPCSNRSFDLYYKMVKNYSLWLNQITEPRSDGFAFDSCTNAMRMDIDGQLRPRGESD